MDPNDISPEEFNRIRHQMMNNPAFRDAVMASTDAPQSAMLPPSDIQRNSANKNSMASPQQRPTRPALGSPSAPTSKPNVAPKPLRPSKPLSGPRITSSKRKPSSPTKAVFNVNHQPSAARSQKTSDRPPQKIARPNVPAIKKPAPPARKTAPSGPQLTKAATEALNLTSRENNQLRKEPAARAPQTSPQRVGSGQVPGTVQTPGKKAATPRENSPCTPSPSRQSKTTSKTPKSSQHLRQFHTSGHQEGDGSSSQRHREDAENSEQDETDADMRARRNIPRLSHLPRPRYTTGEEEYLNSLVDELPSRDLTPEMTRPSRPAKVARESDQMDIDEPDLPGCTPEPPQRFVIGIDYGTTFTSVSYLACPDEASNTRIFPLDIGTISNWPQDALYGETMQVPTQNWYSSIPKFRDPRTGHLEFSDSETEPDSDNDDDEDTPAVAQRKPVRDCFQALRGSVPPNASCTDDDSSPEFLWGYECPYQKYSAYSTRSLDRLVERAKLMLLKTEHTHEDRQKLGPILRHLINREIIRKHGKHDSLPGFRDVQDVVTDFFVPVLQHTRRELIRSERYDDDCSVMFALTVPTIWSLKSSRVLQYALEEAIRITGFGTLNDRSVNNLFVVTEPKAAATYLLGLGYSQDLLDGSTFVVLDCGGGTVDGSAYTVTRSPSLRLGDEICKSGGDNCGASYLNENYRKLLLEKLADETYLEVNGNTLESIVNDTINAFETYEKRNKDVMERPTGRVKIPNLRANWSRKLTDSAARCFTNNFLELNKEDYKRIFLPLLHRVARVLDDQLEAAISLGKEPKKVFLIGGFAGAVSMRSFLKDHLVTFAKNLDLPYKIELVLPTVRECVTAVSAGAVLQALNPEDGQVRRCQSSFGFLSNETYSPDAPGHKNAKPVYEELNGNYYVPVINYFVMTGDIMPPKHRYPPFKNTHIFPVGCKKLRCEEVIYVSDLPTAIGHGYPLTHSNNRDAQIAAKIVTNLTHLLKDGTIQPVGPTRAEDGTVKGEERYELEYELVPYVDGRNIRYEAWYPSIQSGQLVEEGQISITASLPPGTA